MSEKFDDLPQEVVWGYFLQIRKLMLERTGMNFDDAKFKVVRNVLAERINATNSDNFEAYFQLITRSGTTARLREHSQREYNRLIESLVVNETSFFRNRDHFNAIFHEILPQLYRQKINTRRLQFWSAGCSTGQEAYSLAMLVIEFLEQRGEKLASGPNDHSGWKVEILATDISERVLHIAESGRFRREDLRGLDKARLERFFNTINSAHVATAPLDPALIVGPGQFVPVRGFGRAAYEIAPEVRALVKFDYFNLSQIVYPVNKINTFDMILCENVMIYFPPEVTRQVIENIHLSLVEGGYFFIGFSETLWQISERFKLLNTNDTFYYQKPLPNEMLSANQLRNLDIPTTDKLKATSDNRSSEAVTQKREKDSREKDNATAAKAMPLLIKVDTLAPLPNKKAQPETKVTGPPPTNPVINPATEKTPRPATLTKTDWRTPLSEGLSYIEAHDFENSARALDEALEAGPREVDVLCAVAQLKVKLGDYQAAADYSRQAISLNDLCESAHLLLAMIYHRENRLEAAIKEYEKTIYINMDSVVAHMRLADIRDKLGQFNAALRQYRNALSVLEKKRPSDFIEGFPVATLKQACTDNIRRLQGAGRFR